MSGENIDNSGNWRMQPGQLDVSDVQSLLRQHLLDMHDTSPAESVHALDIHALQHCRISFWVLRHKQQLAGCAALKCLSDTHGEIKSMRTHLDYRRRGVAQRLLSFLIEQAKSRGYQRLSLETGSMAFFEPARSLYAKYGFVECQPFADYQADPNSIFMTLSL